MIRVLVADDSAFVRMALRQILERTEQIVVVAELADATALVAATLELAPDVVLLDAVMPGAELATHELGRAALCPVIGIGAGTPEDAKAAIRLLQRGAADLVTRDSVLVALDVATLDRELVAKVEYWAQHGAIRAVGSRPSSLPPPMSANRAEPPRADLVVVGASTGGPRVLLELLRSAGPIGCPMVIAQHMPAYFTAGLAEHLARETGLSVVEGSPGLELTPGLVVVAPGGRDSAIGEARGALVLRVTQPTEVLVHPSVDVLFLSAARHSRRPLAAVLTGMGDDGMAGAHRFAERKLPVLVQEPESCAVDGMPCSVIDAGLATEVLGISRLGKRVAEWAGGIEAKPPGP